MLLLTFTAGVNRYAVDVTRIVELVPRVELRKIPHAPAFLAGLLGYRGSVLPVIDLGLLLDSTPCQDCLSTRIILVDDSADNRARGKERQDNSQVGFIQVPAHPERDSTLLGLLAEHVSDLTYVQPEQIVPVPVSLPHAPYLGAIVQTGEGIVQLIEIDKIREASIQSVHSGRDKAPESTPGNRIVDRSNLEAES